MATSCRRGCNTDWNAMRGMAQVIAIPRGSRNGVPRDDMGKVTRLVTFGLWENGSVAERHSRGFSKATPAGLPGIAAAIIVGIAVVMLGGCATRPSPDVLQPVQLNKSVSLSEQVHAEKAPDRVRVLAATNRSLDSVRGGFGSAWAGTLTYEEYEFSVPPDRKDTAISYPTAKPDPERQFAVIEREQLPKDAFVQQALGSVQADGTIGIFVHGYNYSYQEALFRTAQIAADANIPGAPILFSWPSAAAVAGYVADRDAALASRTELASLVTSLSASGKVKRIVLFGHSMGGFLVMETVRQLKLQHRDDVIGNWRCCSPPPTSMSTFSAPS